MASKATPKKGKGFRHNGKEEKTIPIGLGFCSFGQGSNAAVTDVSEGKIVRIRPLYYDWKYKPE